MANTGMVDNSQLDAKVIELDLAREEEPRPPDFTDEALALRFAGQHARNLRYVAGWKKWFRWNGTHWQSDTTLLAFDLARATCRRASSECKKSRLAALLASAKTVGAVVNLARSDRRLAATVDQWDTDPWLLNTPSGTVDLLTGELRSHRPEYYLTKTTAVGPDERMPTPTWNGFLRRVTNNDIEQPF